MRMNEKLTPTDRTRLRRAHERGRFERETVYAILDAMPLCHVGFVLDGAPSVLPTLQWREGDRVYWHASRAGRGIKAQESKEVCLTVTLLDGMVLARSAFHHSANYRSAMLLGRPEAVTDPEEKLVKMKNLIEAFYPGRWDGLRLATAQEVKATGILSLPITEASAKVRAGGPIDDEEDYALPIWAGVLPLRYAKGEAQPDERNLPGVETPPEVEKFSIG